MSNKPDKTGYDEDNYYFLAKATVYISGEEDTGSDEIVPVEIISYDNNGHIEIAFDTHAGCRRVYLQFNKRNMDATIKLFNTFS